MNGLARLDWASAECRLRPMMALMLLLAAAVQTGASELLPVPQLGVQLRVPEGWRAVEINDGGAVLATTKEASERLEIAVWQPLAAKPSAASAALAHEQVLSSRLAYARQSHEPFVAADGSPAVRAHGLVQTTDGARYACLFSAYCIGDKYFILGTFCPEADTARVSAAYLDEAARSFAKLGSNGTSRVAANPNGRKPPANGGGTPPAPGPVAPDKPGASGGDAPPPAGADPGPPAVPGASDAIPDEPRGTDGSAPVPSGETPAEPTGPAVTTPGTEPTEVTAPAPTTAQVSVVPGDLDLHRDPLGFALAAPSGWQVETVDGCVMCWPKERPRAGGIVVWPVVCSQTAGGEGRVQYLARSWAMQFGTTWRSRSTRQSTDARNVWVCRGETVLDGEPMAAVAVLARSENLDVLSILLARASLSVEDRMTLARALSSFESVPLWVDASPAVAAGAWVAEDGALQVQGLPGWELSGGVSLYNEVPVIALEGRHRDTGARFAWRQPEVPCFKHPSDRLLAAGWQEGAQFAPDQGVDSLVLQRRTGAVAVCRRRSMGTRTLGVTSSRELPAVAALLDGGEGAFASTETTELHTVCLGAVGPAPGHFGRDCWMVASLLYEGPPEALNAAGGALRSVIESVRVLDGWPGTAEQRETLRARVHAAQAVAATLPESGNPQEMAPVLPALNHLVPDGAPEAIQGEVPAELSQIWRAASRRDGAQELLPELLSGGAGQPTS